MICPSCGFENKADEVYCEDCGAVLEQAGTNIEAEAFAPLEPGQILEGRYKILRVVHCDSVSILYEAEAHVEGGVSQATAEYQESEPAEGPVTYPVGQTMLLVEFPGADSKPRTQQLWELLSSVHSASLWQPEALLQEGERSWLIGPWPGEPLSLCMQDKPMTVEEIVSLGVSLLTGLQELHGLGYVHKGVSPNAVWLKQGQVSLNRFERLQQTSVPCTTYSVIEGYSAPEAYGMLSGVVDARSDIYSVGALLYALLAINSGQALAYNSRDNIFSFPALKVPGFASLVQVVCQAVSREPGLRFETATAMAEALQQAMLQGDELPEVPSIPCATVPAAGKATRLLSNEPAHRQPGIQSAGLNGYLVAKKSHVGMVRHVNQDAFVELTISACERDVPTEVHFVAVIDGMGGEVEGDKAASLAARAVSHEIMERFFTLSCGKETNLLLPSEPQARNAFIIERAVKLANAAIYSYASQDPKRKGMGCTMTCVLLDGEQATFGHVGDTRGYRISHELDQVTTDHSVVGQLVQMGSLTREQARTSPRRSLIYRALGTASEIEVDIYHRQLASGEYLMLSSDGVWEYYTDEELLAHFAGRPSPEELCDSLVSGCLQRGADDNTTVAIIYKL